MISVHQVHKKEKKEKKMRRPGRQHFFGWIYIAEKKYNKIESAKIICLEIFDSQNSTKI
jgi:hypothetical protein